MRLLHLIERCEYETLFKITEGFNNNIIWQIGHCITSQQRHMYMRSGLPMYISKELRSPSKLARLPLLGALLPMLMR